MPFPAENSSAWTPAIGSPFAVSTRPVIDAGLTETCSPPSSPDASALLMIAGSSSDWATTLLKVRLRTAPNTAAAAMRPSRERSQRPIRGFWMRVASDSTRSVAVAPKVSIFGCGWPNHGRGLRTSTRTTSCCPGRRWSPAGVKRNSALSSGSTPSGTTCTALLPVLSTTMPNCALVPEITEAGSTIISSVGWLMTSSAIGLVTNAPGSFCDCTCTISSRCPAGKLAGRLMVTSTTATSSGNSDRCEGVMSTQAGSSPKICIL